MIPNAPVDNSRSAGGTASSSESIGTATERPVVPLVTAVEFAVARSEDLVGDRTVEVEFLHNDRALHWSTRAVDGLVYGRHRQLLEGSAGMIIAGGPSRPASQVPSVIATAPSR